MRVLLTGASGGIGAATVAALAGAGMEVLCLARDPARLDQLAARLGPNAVPLHCDLADPAAVAGVLATLAGGPVDVLVNNAGHDTGGGVPFDAMAEADWANVLAVNLCAAMRLTQALLPAFLAADAGHVVMIGSITTHGPAPGLAAYATSKYALHGFAQTLRADYAATGLRVTEITPGVVRTGLAERRMHGDTARARAFYDGFAATLSPDDVARAVLFAIQQPPGCCVENIVLMPTRRRQ